MKYFDRVLSGAIIWFGICLIQAADIDPAAQKKAHADGVYRMKHIHLRNHIQAIAYDMSKAVDLPQEVATITKPESMSREEFFLSQYCFMVFVALRSENKLSDSVLKIICGEISTDEVKNFFKIFPEYDSQSSSADQALPMLGSQ